MQTSGGNNCFPFELGFLTFSIDDNIRSYNWIARINVPVRIIGSTETEVKLRSRLPGFRFLSIVGINTGGGALAAPQSL